jgi:hypothetical protein
MILPSQTRNTLSKLGCAGDQFCYFGLIPGPENVADGHTASNAPDLF